MQNITDCQDDIIELDSKLKEAKAAKKEASALAKTEKEAAQEAKKAATALAKAEKAAQRERRKAMAMGVAEDFVDGKQVYFLGKQNHFIIKTEDGEWCYLKAAALRTMFPALGKADVYEAFTYAMSAYDRMYFDCLYSLGDVPSDKLNLMDRTTWITPEPGEYHWLLDLLIHSIAGGDPKKAEHLERCIVYKFLHPNCPSLPCVVIDGEGSAGKNLLVEQVLSVVFGGATLSAFAQSVLEKFNSPLKGKVCVLVDEARASKIDHEKLKNMLGSSTLWINEKGVVQFETPAIAWYLISSNKNSIFLDRSSADRRWSVFHIPPGKDIYHWLRPKLGNVSYAEAETWLKANAIRILRDPQNVARWMHALITKYEGQAQPLPFHDEDFKRLMDLQKPIDEQIIEDVFCDPDFTHINRQTLNDGYRARCDGDCRPLPPRYFNERVRSWLIAHPELEIAPEEVVKKQRTTKNNEFYWCRDGISSAQITDNSPEYLDRSSTPPKWIGSTGR